MVGSLTLALFDLEYVIEPNFPRFFLPCNNNYFIAAQSNFGCERSRYRSGNLSLATSPRWDISSMSVISPSSLCGHNVSYHCQEDNKSNNHLRAGIVNSFK